MLIDNYITLKEMRKKEYLSPTMSIVRLQHIPLLLQESSLEDYLVKDEEEW
jgi:hypothetical protein